MPDNLNMSLSLLHHAELDVNYFPCSKRDILFSCLMQNDGHLIGIDTENVSKQKHMACLLLAMRHVQYASQVSLDLVINSH